MNRRSDNTRVSSSLAYLSGCRSRPNLHIRAGGHVARLTIERARATGVELASGERIEAGSGVVLCAGAFGTPAILMRSGIGNPPLLAQHGIEPVLARPGVGARLYDHPSVPIRMIPLPGECDPLRDPRFQMVARLVTADRAPLVLALVSFLDVRGNLKLVEEAGGAPVVATLSTALMDPAGAGRVTLSSPDPLAPPHIELGFDNSDADLAHLAEGVRLAWQLVDASPLSRAIQRAAGLNADIVGSDSMLRDYILGNTGSFHHPCGTASMGREDDPFAVTDQHGRVHGLGGLWIADASIMPRGVTVPPNLTIMAMGERIAAWIVYPETT